MTEHEEKAELTPEEKAAEELKNLGPRIQRRSFDNAFNQGEQFNNLRYLVETGQDPRDLLMRSMIPSTKSDAYRLMIAYETILKKCIKYHDTEGEREVRDILAMLPSLDGKAREQLVRAMVGGYFGDKENGGGDGEGLTAKLRRVAFGR